MQSSLSLYIGVKMWNHPSYLGNKKVGDNELNWRIISSLELVLQSKWILPWKNWKYFFKKLEATLKRWETYLKKFETVLNNCKNWNNFKCLSKIWKRLETIGNILEKNVNCLKKNLKIGKHFNCLEKIRKRLENWKLPWKIVQIWKI